MRLLRALAERTEEMEAKQKMIHSEFERAKKDLKQGDKLALTLRGNYGRYRVEDLLVAFRDDRVYLLHGFSHHYKRIISMCKVEANK